LRLKLNSPLTLWNEDEVEAMYALADELGLPIQFDPLITRRDNGDADPQRLSPSEEGIARLHAQQRERDVVRRANRQCATGMPAVAASLEARATGREKHCGAGSSSITIDPFGNVYPCVQWRRKIGNLHEDSIGALWNGSTALAEVRRLSYEVRKAVDDHQAWGLGFCPGSAEQETGNPTQLYPGIRVLRDMRVKAKVA
jgi:radical SAM protein with 4Fe4S-binding SPASM domain